jgi:hypothetical protein
MHNKLVQYNVNLQHSQIDRSYIYTYGKLESAMKFNKMFRLILQVLIIVNSFPVR